MRRCAVLVCVLSLPVLALACNALVGLDSLEKIQGTSGTSLKVSVVASGGSHSCAIMSDGSVMCWGQNESGQLGSGDTAAHLTPGRVPGIAAAIFLSCGASHTCVVLEDTTVRCWGSNASGQLGIGRADDNPHPKPEDTSLQGAKKIQTGNSHTCAEMADKTVKCWGANGLGQLGDGTTADRFAPVPVSDLTGVGKLSSAGDHACAAANNDAGVAVAFCWGDNQDGKLGVAFTETRSASKPILVPGLTGVDKVFVGANHSCAVIGDRVRCWGANNFDQLGSPQVASGPAAEVVGVTGAGGGLMVGDRHTCALDDSARVVRCWGANDRGQLGVATSGSQTQAPVVVDALKNVTNIGGAKSEQACAISDRLYCWGANENGQLGDGTKVDRAKPTPVKF
jgi:alpha-tubulin suppressor-like RCC1 family protein